MFDDKVSILRQTSAYDEFSLLVEVGSSLGNILPRLDNLIKT